MEYKYPKITGGYHWNMLMRCEIEVGIKPIGCHTTNTETVIQFNNPLTNAQKILLDTLMVNNPSFPPVSVGTVFKIEDIWERLGNFRVQSGINFNMYFSESIANSGKIDMIEIHAPSILTNQQINKVKTEFAKLITVQ